ncbi:cryptochrome [Rhizodiscina lignyota]|uniref:Cryptochrome DASH n=1 Tax=Rhizodiscina lignyota TaxID=1504668 RepID=A0A9P4IF94_9PEZI|nr:cryptochrome [Rhizodiscina lignyota]
MTTKPPRPRILIYLLRRDLRLTDNPVLHEIARAFSSPSPSFTHLLPIYVFPAQQVEVSGFLRKFSKEEYARSPYPPARSPHGDFWRCGPHRAKFLTESVWNVKESLQDVGSGLIIRVGMLHHVINDALEWFDGNESDTLERRDSGPASDTDRGEIVGVWMTKDETTEEKTEEQGVRAVVEGCGKEFRLFEDEKYFVDDRDLPFQRIEDLPNIYTTFRQQVEPLRSRPRRPLPPPKKLPPLPPAGSVPPQTPPFSIPDSLDTILTAVLAPLETDPYHGLPNVPSWPSNTESAHPFRGGETEAQERMWHLLSSGAMTSYKDTRNGLLGTDFSTKLAGFLALGCVSARWVHAEMLEFEGGSNFAHQHHSNGGFNDGENPGTAGVRFELLWRDYMRLCARKFGPKLFHLTGFVDDEEKKWKSVDHSTPGLGDDPDTTKDTLNRFLEGRTGIGLIDAAQRELFLTGYTSNRARQNVASFLAKHLGIDWRLGAEWYECMLVDYDCASNWGNWQYVAGVGNDPRQGRTFNPIKQALDYDKNGEYIKAWVPELRGLETGSQTAHQAGAQEHDQEALMGVFQAWRMAESDKEALGLKGVDWVERPLVKIPFEVRRSGASGRGRGRGRGRGGPGRGRGAIPYVGGRGERWKSGE